ncbi:lysine--tRNA ligase, partial [candidate division KSB1 bacterium]|nr:lysine--tRNA ligase [candidate division KSB1 bacterium]
MKIRREKLSQLNELGVQPYAYKFDRTHFAQDILSDFDSFEGNTVSLGGRLMAIRGHGKAAFAHLVDSSGRIQFYIRQDKVG